MANISVIRGIPQWSSGSECTFGSENQTEKTAGVRCRASLLSFTNSVLSIFQLTARLAGLQKNKARKHPKSAEQLLNRGGIKGWMGS